MKPKVSVVIPAYNRAEKVQRAIDSALTQSFSDMEVIVVDDGSTDNSRQVLAGAYGDSIRYFYQPNQGASVARNRGVAEARGEWIAFLDSDDLWEKDKLEWQLKTLERFSSQCGACYTDVRMFNHEETRTFFELAAGNYLHEGLVGINRDVLRLLVRPGGAGMVVCLSSLIVRADAFRETGGFDPNLLYSQDSDLMFRLALRMGFCYVNRPLVRFDRSPAELRHVGVSSEWNKMDFWLRDSQQRLEGLLRLDHILPQNVRKLIRRQLGEIHSGWANWYLNAGDYAKARESVWISMRFHPTASVAAKLFLTSISPSVALHILRRRQDSKKDSPSIV